MTESAVFHIERRVSIKDGPELQWSGKRTSCSVPYYPARLRMRIGESFDQCRSKIFWGDNLHVMGHLLAEYRGRIDLIYIDPPFDSRADYKKKIQLKGMDGIAGKQYSIEEKQYGDIWSSEEYLQFMYDRLLVMRELLSDTGSIYLHCDWHKSTYLRMLMDEVFGASNFRNEIIWSYKSAGMSTSTFPRKHDNIFYYTKSNTRTFHPIYIPHDQKVLKRFQHDENGPYQFVNGKKYYANAKGKPIEDVWEILLANRDGQRTGYPTQKPEALLERIIRASSNPGDLVMDCFMGSGTTQAAAMKLGRRFIGVDINFGAVYTTAKRLLTNARKMKRAAENNASECSDTEFDIFDVNQNGRFKNPVEARRMIYEILNIRPLPAGSIWDGELNGRFIKVMSVNRPMTFCDADRFLYAISHENFVKKIDAAAADAALPISLICTGCEPGIEAKIKADARYEQFNIEIIDILRSKINMWRKPESKADIICKDGRLIIRSFYPNRILHKLSLQKKEIKDWRRFVDSVVIDWHYDGYCMNVELSDIPDKNRFVTGVYEIPADAGAIKVIITDIIFETADITIDACVVK